MEHLPIYLAEEALLGEPVQYRWMYPFERYFDRLKPTAKNKARVEAFMVQAYLPFEIKYLLSIIFSQACIAQLLGVIRVCSNSNHKCQLYWYSTVRVLHLEIEEKDILLRRSTVSLAFTFY